ncbi:hypothetical protein CC77DRAFT_439572 [Alternaria alternata]|uniref:DUF7730 domain-containing protein n=1 Tax=Alternaria alternata TaxID=5599 RepID=A0A177D7Y4_ALTAL|nr:hypothetical protein CC77DRAFT_439572 [Alternaria alternata]OAG15824.1 hypothetical protein CC77DRAFT_439572 [Alternaria alternata]
MRSTTVEPGEALERKVEEYKPRETCNTTRTKSNLLCLPAEIRMMIWECLVAEKLIIFYRKGGQITSSFLDRHGTLSINKATSHIVYDVANRSRTKLPPTRSKSKADLMALLQTCQTISLEATKVFYQENTFVCLDSVVLVDLCNGQSSSNMSLIRSLQYSIGTRKFFSSASTQSEREMVPSPCDVETSESVSKFFHRRFPNLRNLSIFLYGPPSHDEEYANMLGHLQNVYVQRISITMNALELPEAYFVRNATLPSLPYTDGRVRVVVSSTRPGCFISYQKAIEWENPRVEDDTWITGSLWLGPLHEADATLKLLTYAVLIPEDEKEHAVQEHEPALLWDIIPAEWYSSCSFA